jgi:ABC-2 type transport system permease protein
VQQRDVIHAGWDQPKDATMQAFYQHYPQYAASGPITSGFHWKWYFAFQYLGDLAVAQLATDYHNTLLQQDQLTNQVGYLLPVVALQSFVYGKAETGVVAQLTHLNKIRLYHAQIREFYYPYLFAENPFMHKDFALIPTWPPKIP